MAWIFDKNGWLDNAIQINAESKSFGINNNKPTHIVIHGTSGFVTATETAYYFRDSTVQAATHFIIGKDGTVVQCGRLGASMWGNGFNNQGKIKKSGNPNYWTISIEHVKNPGNLEDLTAKQKDASFKLILALCNKLNIPKRIGDSTGGIIYHKDLDPGNKSFCPGPFPMTDLLQYLQTGDLVVIDISKVSNYFTEANNVWTCKQTGKVIHGGILAKYKKVGGYDLCGLTDLGLPLTNEIDISTTDTAGKKHYATFQVYERGILIYDPDGVIDRPPGNTDTTYKAHIDTNLNPKVLDLQTKLDTAQTEIEQARKDIANYDAIKAQLDAANKTIADLQIEIQNANKGNVSDAAKVALNTAISQADNVVAQLRNLNNLIV